MGKRDYTGGRGSNGKMESEAAQWDSVDRDKDEKGICQACL